MFSSLKVSNINSLMLNSFTPTRYPTWSKKIQLAFCNTYGGIKRNSEKSFPYVT